MAFQSHLSLVPSSSGQSTVEEAGGSALADLLEIEVAPVAESELPESAEARPDERLSADSLARSLFNTLRSCSRIDRAHVLAALIERLAADEGPDPKEFKRQRSLAALSRCLADKGRVSRATYDLWRDEQPDRDDLPSSKYIRDAFGGSWEAAKAALVGQAPRFDPTAQRLLAIGSAFTGDDLLAAVAAFAIESELELLTMTAFLDRCREVEEDRLSALRARRSSQLDSSDGSDGLSGLSEWPHPDWPARIPRSRSPFKTLRLMFHDVLGLLGLLDRCAHCSGAAAPRQTIAPVEPIYDDDDCLDWLRRAAKTEGTSMNLETYDGWAVRERTRERAKGKVVRVPSSSVIVGHFKSWAVALWKAGLISKREAAVRCKRGRKITTAQVEADLDAAIDRCGPDITLPQYLEWRDARIDQLLETDPLRPVASEGTVRQRLGQSSWHRAVANRMAARLEAGR